MEPPTPKSLGGVLPPVRDSARVLAKECADTQLLVDEARKPLKDLAAAVEGLEGRTMQMALLGGQIGTKQEISEFRRRMQEQEQRHQEGIQEIQGILDEMLRNHVVEGMRQQVEQEIGDHIDDLIKEGIAECLKDHIPPDVQEEIAASKKELDRVRLALYNSESRRLNGSLRSENPNEVLNTMYTSAGTVSQYYPKTLRELFTLDGKAINALMKDYELPNHSGNRDHALNRFMQFCGVKYQLVRRRTAENQRGDI
jgi:hypothetical protein